MCPPNVRQVCRRAIGQRVVVRDSNGRVYDGILHSVTDEGVLVRPLGFRAQTISKNMHGTPEESVHHAISDGSDRDGELQPVFWWWFLILWALIAGFWWWGAGWGWGAYGRGYRPYGAYGTPYGAYGGRWRW